MGHESRRIVYVADVLTFRERTDFEEVAEVKLFRKPPIEVSFRMGSQSIVR